MFYHYKICFEEKFSKMTLLAVFFKKDIQIYHIHVSIQELKMK